MQQQPEKLFLPHMIRPALGGVSELTMGKQSVAMGNMCLRSTDTWERQIRKGNVAPPAYR